MTVALFCLYCTVLYCAVLYCTLLHCTVLYCTVLYCILHLNPDHVFEATLSSQFYGNNSAAAATRRIYALDVPYHIMSYRCWHALGWGKHLGRHGPPLPQDLRDVTYTSACRSFLDQQEPGPLTEKCNICKNRRSHHSTISVYCTSTKVHVLQVTSSPLL